MRDGGGVWRGDFPLPTRGGVWEEGSAPNLLVFDLKMVNFGVF